MFSTVLPMHDRCGAASMPSPRISSTVASVPSRVLPPAPNVTEQNAGRSCESWRRAARSFSTPSGVRGGKNSRLNRAVAAHRAPPSLRLLRHQQRGQRPRDQAVDDRAEDARPESGHAKAGHERADRPEQQAVQHEDEQAERQQRDRQRQQEQQRPDQRVDEAEHERCDQRSADRIDLHPLEHVRQQEQRGGIDQPVQEDAHHAAPLRIRRAVDVRDERRVDGGVHRRRNAGFAPEPHDRAAQPRRFEPVAGDEVVQHRRAHLVRQRVAERELLLDEVVGQRHALRAADAPGFAHDRLERAAHPRIGANDAERLARQAGRARERRQEHELLPQRRAGCRARARCPRPPRSPPRRTLRPRRCARRRTRPRATAPSSRHGARRPATRSRSRCTRCRR